MSQIAEQLQLFDEVTVDNITVPSPAHSSARAAPRRRARAANADKPTVVDEILRLWAQAKPRDRKKLLVTIDQAHRLHKQTTKPAGRVTAGAASASDKRVNAAIAATKELTPEEIAVFAEWFNDYRNDLIDEGAPSPGGGTGVRQIKIVDSR
jgi:translation elongation factor EF-Tu-like GTPase